MTLLMVLIWVLVAGFVCWLIKTAPLPIHPWFRMLAIGIIVLAVVLWVLSHFGFHTGIRVY